MGIRERYSVCCDWCGYNPGEQPWEFDGYGQAYSEVLRLTRFESWFKKDVGDGQFKLLCPDCASEGR